MLGLITVLVGFVTTSQRSERRARAVGQQLRDC
jgi:hypothetical protein